MIDTVNHATLFINAVDHVLGILLRALLAPFYTRSHTGVNIHAIKLFKGKTWLMDDVLFWKYLASGREVLHCAVERIMIGEGNRLKEKRRAL
jgi:hypothetical protein